MCHAVKLLEKHGLEFSTLDVGRNWIGTQIRADVFGYVSPAKIYEDTITIAVQLGYDMDCNGATAGSIIGLMLGADHLPEKWIAPLQDTLQSTVSGFGEVKFSDLSRRTYELSRAIRWATAPTSS